ncbi:MAG: GTPase domain-containing protein [Pseudomonadota bacterium]
MSAALADFVAAVQAWAERAAALGWLEHQDDFARLESLDGTALFESTQSAPAAADAAVPPLVVALFGGTGVGKSSLLNRLAGADVARVGVVRPTSLSATAYVHEAVSLAELPIDGLDVVRHAAASRRRVVWVDMPDIDSTATANRDLVLGFLPYVDLLVYVVSPERYRDEAPWQLLRDKAQTSAWLFVLNQLDRAQPGQREDFVTVLDRAGFDAPLVFATSCVADLAEDEFAELAAFVDQFGDTAQAAGLRDANRAARRAAALDVVLAASAGWPSNGAALREAWQTSSERLADALGGDLVERLAGVTAKLAREEAVPDAALWDDWAGDRVRDGFTQAALMAASQGEWRQPVLQRFAAMDAAELTQRAVARLRDGVDRALAKPGGPLRRAAHGASQQGILLLPLGALLWIAWFVISGFHDGASGSGAFVAPGFAMNALLLLAVAFGLPAIGERLLRPSPRRAAQRGIERGLAALMVDIDAHAQARIDELESELLALLEQRNEWRAAVVPDRPASQADRLRGRRPSD